MRRTVTVIAILGGLVLLVLVAYRLSVNDIAYVWLPNDLQLRGDIQPGQRVQQTIGERAKHGWTFENAPGQHHQIRLIALTRALDDLNLYVYGPDGRLYDMRANRSDTLMRVQLPLAGVYTIVVRSDMETGPYQLTLE